MGEVTRSKHGGFWSNIDGRLVVSFGFQIRFPFVAVFIGILFLGCLLLCGKGLRFLCGASFFSCLRGLCKLGLASLARLFSLTGSFGGEFFLQLQLRGFGAQLFSLFAKGCLRAFNLGLRLLGFVHLALGPFALLLIGSFGRLQGIAGFLGFVKLFLTMSKHGVAGIPRSEELVELLGVEHHVEERPRSTFLVHAFGELGEIVLKLFDVLRFLLDGLLGLVPLRDGLLVISLRSFVFAHRLVQVCLERIDLGINGIRFGLLFCSCQRLGTVGKRDTACEHKRNAGAGVREYARNVPMMGEILLHACLG